MSTFGYYAGFRSVTVMLKFIDEIRRFDIKASTEINGIEIPINDILDLFTLNLCNKVLLFLEGEPENVSGFINKMRGDLDLE